MGRSRKVKFSLILTGYNEGPQVLQKLFYLKNILNHSTYTWEIILFDDGSSDETLKYFSTFADEEKRVKVYSHRKNCGRGKTIKDAIEKSSGEIVGYLDTDLELSPIHIFEFVDKINSGFDVVIATRFYSVNIHNLLRTIISKSYIFLMHLFLGVHFKDTEAGFKFFNRRKILPVLKEIKDDRWFFDTEMVVRSYLSGLKITDVPVIYVKDINKKSSVNLVRDSYTHLVKLVAFRKAIRGNI